MTGFPDFATLAFDAAEPRASTSIADGAPWLTAEGIAIQPRYGAADIAGLDFPGGLPGLAPLSARSLPHSHVRATNPWTIRQYAEASPRLRSPTPSTGATWRPGRWACRWPSTWPLTAATTATTSG